MSRSLLLGALLVEFIGWRLVGVNCINYLLLLVCVRASPAVADNGQELQSWMRRQFDLNLRSKALSVATITVPHAQRPVQQLVNSTLNVHIDAPPPTTRAT